MKPAIFIAALLLVLTTILRAASPLEQAALDLYQSLTPDQRKQVTLPFDSPERTKEVFPAGKRPGIQLRDLTDVQREKASALLRTFVSDYGWDKAQAIAKQDSTGIERFYLTYFGEPAAGKEYAWRLAEHHLTLLHVEYADGKLHSVGPILLGADPGTLWPDEEDQLISLFGTLNAAEKEKAVKTGKSISSAPIKDAGVAVSELNTDAQKKVQEVFEGRLRFFSPAVADQINQMLQDNGGLKSQKVAFWGEATKRCADGGRWDFKLGSKNFLCDYENTRGHIHLSVKASKDTGPGADERK
jgi:hypothetical protein